MSMTSAPNGFKLCSAKHWRKNNASYQDQALSRQVGTAEGSACRANRERRYFTSGKQRRLDFGSDRTNQPRGLRRESL